MERYGRRPRIGGQSSGLCKHILASAFGGTELLRQPAAGQTLGPAREAGGERVSSLGEWQATAGDPYGYSGERLRPAGYWQTSAVQANGPRGADGTSQAMPAGWSVGRTAVTPGVPRPFPLPTAHTARSGAPATPSDTRAPAKRKTSTRAPHGVGVYFFCFFLRES